MLVVEMSLEIWDLGTLVDVVGLVLKVLQGDEASDLRACSLPIDKRSV